MNIEPRRDVGEQAWYRFGRQFGARFWDQYWGQIWDDPLWHQLKNQFADELAWW